MPMETLQSHEACVTLWPTEAAVSCRPFTDDEARCHFHTASDSELSRSAMLAQVIDFCLSNGCSTIHIRQENWED